jgi:peptidoglycan-associated lipoprotein
MKLRQFTTVALIATGGVWTAACHKKVATAPPPPPAAVQTARSAIPPPPPNREEPRPAAASAPVRSRMPDAATRQKIDELLARIQDAYFDYDKHLLRPDAESALQTDAKTLADIIRQYPDFKLRVTGQCDERGSAEYNLALGERRAAAAKEYLVNLGLPADQMNTLSLGKEKPVCTEHNETCWQKNRRAHLAAADSANGS